MRTNAKIRAAGYRERTARVTVHCDAVLTESDGCRIDVVITDVSRDGFRLHSRAELVPGDEVSLHVPKSEPVRARIHWARGYEAGGIFMEAVAL